MDIHVGNAQIAAEILVSDDVVVVLPGLRVGEGDGIALECRSNRRRIGKARR